MELSPQSVASTTFKIVKKGYDPDEVKAYLAQLAGAIETTQNQATAMEARARAAVVRLQEIAAQPAAAPAPAPVAEPTPARAPEIALPADEAGTISRTLLLAQRTADNTVAEAEHEAAKITDRANAEASSLINGAQEVAGRVVEDARAEARRASEGQRIQIESEVQSLLARREFLLSDVDHLEQHIVTQRDRLRDVASTLTDLVAKVPGGLADVRRPLISASGDEPAPTSPASTTDDAPIAGDDQSELDPTEAMARFEIDVPDDDVLPDSVSTYDDGADGGHDETAPDTGQATVVSSSPTSPPTDPIDPTPPAGTSDQFLFDEITDQVRAVDSGQSPRESTSFVSSPENDGDDQH